MALQQNNRNQSRVRVNLSNILGLTEERQRIIAQNYNRIYGGYHAVYFNGATAASDAAGVEPTCFECGGNPDLNKPDSGGGGGGDDDKIITPPSCDECVSLSEAVAIFKKGQTPCCVQGTDCDTGETVYLNLKKDYPEYPPRPPECDEEHRLITFYLGSYSYCTMTPTIFGTFCLTYEQYRQIVENLKGQVDAKGGEVCYSTMSEESIERTFAGYGFSYVRRFGTNNENFYSFGVSGGINQLCTAPKKYGMVNGKMVNLCDPYGEPEQDCKTLCDANGKKYTVCTNNGQPEINEVA